MATTKGIMMATPDAGSPENNGRPQDVLMDKFLALARSQSGGAVVRTLLQEILELATGLTGAQQGSLFLIDRNGRVINSIIARNDVSSKEKQELVGKVLDKGLAGWVRNHLTAGLIEDTATDPRWIDLPGQPYTVRSALATPIIRNGELLGIITLLHARPGHFSAAASKIMQTTAEQISLPLENARLFRELKASYRSLNEAKQAIDEYSRALDREMETGRRIQMGFLPDRMPVIEGWEVAACFHSARQVSGDFYDALCFDNNHLGIVIADVCDKGVGSALFMALIRSLIRVYSESPESAEQGRAPAAGVPNEVTRIQLNALDAVARTNNYIARHHGDMCMFTTLFFGVLNLQTGLMAYVNGGHEPPLLRRADSDVHQLGRTGPAVGVIPDAEFGVDTVRLLPGDLLLCFTDGITEALDAAGRPFTIGRTLAILDIDFPTAADFVRQLEKDISLHIRGAQQFDDITMIALKRIRSQR